MVADVVGPQRGADPVKHRNAVEWDEGANLLPAGERVHLRRGVDRVPEGDGQPLLARRHQEEIGREPGLREAARHRVEDGVAVRVLEGLEAGIAERSKQPLGAGTNRGQVGCGLTGHAWQELAEAGLGETLWPEEPDPADLLRRQAAVARLPPHHLRMPVDRRRHLLHGEEVGQFEGERHGRLCDATLHCSLQRRKVPVPTSYLPWTRCRPDPCPNAGPSW